MSADSANPPASTIQAPASVPEMEKVLTDATPIAPLTLEARASRLLTNLRRIKDAAHPDLAGAYTIAAVAIEGWLPTAIAAAESIEAEARGDAQDPGGEHGGPAD